MSETTLPGFSYEIAPNLPPSAAAGAAALISTVVLGQAVEHFRHADNLLAQASALPGTAAAQSVRAVQTARAEAVQALADGNYDRATDIIASATRLIQLDTQEE